MRTILLRAIPPFSPTAPFLSEKNLAELREAGIELLADADHRPADVRVTGKLGKRQHLLQAWRDRRTPILVWTDEPRHDYAAVKLRRGWGVLPDVHFMNCYTGDVFVDNFRFALPREPLAPEDSPGGVPTLTNRKAIALMTYREDAANWSLKVRGRELDQCVTRCEIALALHREGLMDICGRGWPAGVKVLENSRGNDAGYVAQSGWGQWQARKLDLLRPYAFNLAFENTNSAFYTTEKLWDAIAGGCLPIYNGEGNRIYDDFPRDSFIDYARLGTPAALMALMRGMSAEEYRTRMGRCVEVYNRAVREDFCARSERRMLDQLIERLRRMAGGR